MLVLDGIIGKICAELGDVPNFHGGLSPFMT
jgi:hypothetical protein